MLESWAGWAINCSSTRCLENFRVWVWRPSWIFHGLHKNRRSLRRRQESLRSQFLRGCRYRRLPRRKCGRFSGEPTGKRQALRRRLRSGLCRKKRRCLRNRRCTTPGYFRGKTAIWPDIGPARHTTRIFWTGSGRRSVSRRAVTQETGRSWPRWRRSLPSAFMSAGGIIWTPPTRLCSAVSVQKHIMRAASDI